MVPRSPSEGLQGNRPRMTPLQRHGGERSLAEMFRDDLGLQLAHQRQQLWQLVSQGRRDQVPRTEQYVVSQLWRQKSKMQG